MKRKIGFAALGLVACLVFQGTSTSAETPEQPLLPWFYSETGTMVIDLLTGHVEGSSYGVSSHTGLFDNQSTGQVDFLTMTFHSEGTLTAANGDQIFWEGGGTLGGPGAADFVIMVTGGTGRFENATGEMSNWFITSQELSQEGYFLIANFTETATGWISY